MENFKNVDFFAMKVSEKNGEYIREIVKKKISDLPEGDLIIKVDYSSLNYKDALSASGNRGVTKKYPHTPGVDAAGEIYYSNSKKFIKGDKVIVTGYDLGMNTAGGYGQYISVPEDWVVKLPKNLTVKESMMFGTAGFTAALSVYYLKERVDKKDGDVLVTGGTGGVAGIAIRILSKIGYTVYTSTGKLEKEKELKKLGASEVIHRKEIDSDNKKPLLKGRWAGVIDSVGGNTLSTALRSVNMGGAVTSCGNVAGHEFYASVYPFILRGITLYGVNSAETPMDKRLKIWKLLSGEWKIENLKENVEELKLENLSKKIDDMLEGELIGRVIVDMR